MDAQPAPDVQGARTDGENEARREVIHAVWGFGENSKVWKTWDRFLKALGVYEATLRAAQLTPQHLNDKQAEERERMASACEQAAVEGMNIPEDVRGALMDAAAALRGGSAPLEQAGERDDLAWRAEKAEASARYIRSLVQEMSRDADELRRHLDSNTPLSRALADEIRGRILEAARLLCASQPEPKPKP
jgi:hypothetical protein